MSITINDTPYPFDGEDIECFYDAIDAVIRKAEWTEKQFMGFATVPSIKKDNKTINMPPVHLVVFNPELFEVVQKQSTKHNKPTVH